MEMVKLQSSKYAFSLVSSIVLNLLLLFYLFVGDNSRKLLSWGSRAAAEAEAVASLSCSGHGRAYLDGLLVDGIPVCECNSCFDGPDCSVFVQDPWWKLYFKAALTARPSQGLGQQHVPLGIRRLLLLVGKWAVGICVTSNPDSNLEAFSHNPEYGSFASLAFESSAMTNCANQRFTGDPLLLEPFWMQHAASSAILVAGWHRMSYSFDEKSSIISQELKKHIRRVHAIVGNAVTDQRFIVFGAGSTQLLNAAVHALSLDSTSSPSAVVVSAPFYPTDFFDSLDYKFYGDTSMGKNTSDVSTNVIEFVISPNNPDGMWRKEVLQGPSRQSNS
ncbi:hypothetical protein RJ639_013537 [Escallonia herrerae]|uniref:Uncharacterized protein n=1 Tax=Escallonia herrerae TaxID=1293975 RepID=A0AA88VQ22_9ASTE|nr:hypothetical protein RJ639_013537 [Escallonia herrerae]